MRRHERAIGIIAAGAIIAGLALCGGCVTTATDQLDKGWASDLLGWATSWADSLDEAEVQGLWDQAEHLREIIEGKIELPVPVVPTNTAGVVLDQRASFLFDNAAGPEGRDMNRLWIGSTVEEVDRSIARHKANGDNAVWLFAYNERDGGPVPTTFYNDGQFGDESEVNEDRLKAMQQRLDRYKAAGFYIVLWCIADDSPIASRASQAQHETHARLCHKYFNPRVDGYCWCLEADEANDSRKKYAAGCIRILQDLSDHRIGIHLVPNSWELAIAWGADDLYYQYGFGQSPAQCASETADIIRKLDGRAWFIGAEYHKSSDSAEAKAIGVAIAAIPGVHGTGNGR